MQDGPERLLRIGEVAERVGLSLRTVRFWEEEGIVRATARSPGGFRLYSEADVERLLIVKLMKPLRLTLDEMRELLGLVESAGENAEAVGRDLTAVRLSDYAERARERRRKIERDLEHVNELLATIEALLAAPVTS